MAKLRVGAVDRVGDEDVGALLDEREERGRARREARRHEHRPVAALERRQRLLERVRGRGAEPAVVGAGDVAGAVGPLPVPLLERRGEDRRGMENWRIDRTFEAFRVAAGVHRLRVVVHGGVRGSAGAYCARFERSL